MNRKHDVLISYSTKDKNVADAIVVDLEQHGIRCWYAPRDILPGEHWVSAIKNGIEEAQAVVLVFTEDSNSSPQVMNEIAMAFNAGKTIIPFRLSDGDMNPELEYYLSRVHWLDAVSSSMSQDIERLRKNVQAIVKNDETADADETDSKPDEAPAVVKSETVVSPVSDPVSDPVSTQTSGMTYEEYIALPKNAEINEQIKKNMTINYIVAGVGVLLYLFLLGLIFTSIIIVGGIGLSFYNSKKKQYKLAIVALVLELPMLLTLIWTIPIMKSIKELEDGYKALG